MPAPYLQCEARLTTREFMAWLWLDEITRGRSTAKVAAAHKVAVRTVQAAVRDVRRQLDGCKQYREELVPPRLFVFFGCRPLTPRSTCNHGRVEIPRGDHQCCGICDRSGLDHLPYFHREPEPDPCKRRDRRHARG